MLGHGMDYSQIDHRSLGLERYDYSLVRTRQDTNPIRVYVGAFVQQVRYSLGGVEYHHVFPEEVQI